MTFAERRAAQQRRLTALEGAASLYPWKIKASKAFIAELEAVEEGSMMDRDAARESGEEDGSRTLVGDFIGRHKTQIEVRSDAELLALYVALGSGLIGHSGYARQANRIMDEIRDRVREIDPGTVRRIPRQDGY